MMKPLTDIPRRLQGFRRRLQNYDITVQYKPGSEQYIADGPSHNPQPSKENYNTNYENEVNAVSHVLTGEQWRERLLKETNNDETMNELKSVITEGWLDDNVKLLTVSPERNSVTIGEVDNLPNTLSKTAIKKLKTHMSRYGQCDIVISDDRPQFMSNDFESFAKSCNFIHRTSSPYHPQGNGRAKAAVQIAKSILYKARNDKKDAYKALLVY
eukprot:gene13058-14400_t